MTPLPPGPLLLPLLALSVILSVPLRAQPAAPTATADPRAEITALLTEFLANNSDPAQHDRFWADDLVYTSAKAEVFGKAHIMEQVTAAKPGSGKTPAADATYSADAIVVRPYGTTAALTFRLIAREPGGKTTCYRNSGTLLFRNGRWQVVTWQATKEPASENKT